MALDELAELLTADGFPRAEPYGRGRLPCIRWLAIVETYRKRVQRPKRSNNRSRPAGAEDLWRDTAE
jgi:hypothetical protein